MISGRQALATVEQAIGRARAEEGRLDAALRSASGEAVRLRTARMDAFRELARLKLDEGMMGEIDATEARALALVEEWRRDFERASTLRTRARDNAEMAETDRHARAADYEKAAKELHELRTRVEADAVVTAAWAAQRDRIEQLRNVANRAESKAAQAEADRDVKRKPYDADPLFRYLWERRFGSADYASGALTRFIDGWVARLIGYSGARANYALLNDLPSRLREHVRYVRKELQVEEARLTTIEREALVNAGIGALAALLDGLEQAAIEQRVWTLFVKDVTERQGASVDPVMRSAGFARLATLPVAHLKLPFASEEEYLRSLSSNMRSNLRRKLKKAAGIQVDVRSRVDGVEDEILSLRRKTQAHAKANYGDFEELSPLYFREVLQGLTGARLLVYRLSGNLIGFSLILLEADRLTYKYAGFRYPAARDYNLFFLNWMTMVRLCLAHGISHLHAGETTYLTKVRLGCSLERSWIYFRHRHALINPLFKLLGPRIAIDRMDPDLRELGASAPFIRANANGDEQKGRRHRMKQCS